jgi:hypothetical protein
MKIKKIIITPRSQDEFKLMSILLDKLGIFSTVMSEEELEDVGLSHLLRSVDREEKVSKKSVFRKLKN